MDWSATPPPAWAIWIVVCLNLPLALFYGLVAVVVRQRRWWTISLAVALGATAMFNLFVLWSRGS